MSDTMCVVGGVDEGGGVSGCSCGGCSVWNKAGPSLGLGLAVQLLFRVAGKQLFYFQVEDLCENTIKMLFSALRSW